MKKILAFITLVILLVAATTYHASAQKQYKFGYKSAVTTLTSGLTVSVTPRASLALYTLDADTNVTINVVKTYALPGDMIVFKVKALTRNRTITFGSNIEASAPTVTANKTVNYMFYYNGTNYYACGSFAAD